MQHGNDNLHGMRMIRMVSSVFIIGCLGVIYSLGIYPKLYCSAKESNSSEDSPKAGYIFFGIHLFLFAFGTITEIASKCHKTEGRQHPEAIIPEPLNYFFSIIPTVLIIFVILDHFV